MIRRARPGIHTFGDFLELVHDDQKADLIDGVIYMASPENVLHNDLVSWLGTILRIYLEERRLGRVVVNKVAFRLDDFSSPEPDLAFVRHERNNIIRKGYVDGPPDVAVEVVSPDSVERDYEHKRDLYERTGVGEYWIIDPDEARATFLIRSQQESSPFREAELEGTVFHSPMIPGFVLDTKWLWQRPLPNSLPIVQTMIPQKRLT